MSPTKKTLLRTLAVGLTCTAAGAGAGIVGSSSAASPSSATHPLRTRVAMAFRHSVLRHAVHGDLVVAVAGGKFATLTYDRGFVAGVSGDQLTLNEGTKTATYRSVTLTIPAGAIVRLDRGAATLGQLASGDSVFVLQGPNHTRVAAFDASAPSASAPAGTGA